MIKKYKEIKEDIKKNRKLRNVHNRVSVVWLSLKRYYEQSGSNYGTYESMKFIETTYAINEKHQIYKKFQYHISCTHKIKCPLGTNIKDVVNKIRELRVLFRTNIYVYI